MPRRHIPVQELFFGAALAGLTGYAWAQARRRPVLEIQPARASRAEVAYPKAPTASRRRVPVAKLTIALGLVALLAAGMAAPAGRSTGLQDPARPAHSVSKPVGEAAVASRHFYDVPAHIVTPPRKPILPAPRPGERTIALARYADVLGSSGMLAAVEAQRSELSQRLLADPRVHIYSGGRSDLASDRIDPRVVALIEYLADTYGEVSVSCLISGHSHFVHQSAADKKRKRAPVVSAHVYGRAVDISAVAGIPIAGHQEPGGITERTIRQILALPGWLHPKQVISLLDLGGPSFPLPDHADHIHVGY